MLALGLSSSAFVAPVTPAGRNGVATISMIGGRGGQANAGGNGKWAPAWKTKSYTGAAAPAAAASAPAASPAAAASAAGTTTVVQAMKFMQDPTLAGMRHVESRVAQPSASGPSRGFFQRQSCLRLLHTTHTTHTHTHSLSQLLASLCASSICLLST
jgi:hypothetical protein